MDVLRGFSVAKECAIADRHGIMFATNNAIEPHVCWIVSDLRVGI